VFLISHKNVLKLNISKILPEFFQNSEKQRGRFFEAKNEEKKTGKNFSIQKISSLSNPTFLKKS